VYAFVASSPHVTSVLQMNSTHRDQQLQDCQLKTGMLTFQTGERLRWKAHELDVQNVFAFAELPPLQSQPENRHGSNYTNPPAR